LKAVVQVGAGELTSSLVLRDIPTPEAPAGGNVIIDVDLAAVHHGDLFRARKVASLPPGTAYLTRGSEAVGRIRAIGRDVAHSSDLRVGQRVTAFLAPYAWAEHVECPAALVFPAPDDIPDTIAAQLFVNAATAFMVLRAIRESLEARSVTDGVVLLTGASTAVARLLAHLLREAGVETIGLTRSEAAAVRTGRLVPGVRYVAQESVDWLSALERAAGGRAFVALGDCVSGALLTQLSPLIANGATVVTYGGLDPHPVGLTGLDLASRGLELRGIPVFPWLDMTAAEKQADISAALALARAHPALFPAAGAYRLEDWREAIVAVETPGREGFVFLKPR
jgi:NADPH:quinone reductase-like Zn-dependent oxidoreductase